MENIIQDIIRFLNDNDILDDEKAEKALTQLKDCYKNQTALVWDVDDVMAVAEEMCVGLTIAEARQVLKDVARDHPLHGVNWDVIRDAIDIIKG